MKARGCCQNSSLIYCALALGPRSCPLQSVLPTPLSASLRESFLGGWGLDPLGSRPLNGPLSFLETSVIRHVAPNPSHYDVQDRFRIELSEEGTEGRVVGRKDITSVLRAPTYPPELQGQPDPTPHPGPPSWTAPPSAQHFPESEFGDGNSESSVGREDLA